MTRKFYVGQRVRVVKSTNAPHLVGTVTTVTSCAKTWGGKSIYELDIPCSSGDESKLWERWWATPHDIEPLDDGHEKTSWSSLADIWQPKGVGVS